MGMQVTHIGRSTIQEVRTYAIPGMYFLPERSLFVYIFDAIGLIETMNRYDNTMMINMS